MERRLATIEHGDTKNEDALGVALNDIAMAVLMRQQGKHKTAVFTYRGERLRSANTKAWRKALVRAGIKNFRWHDLRHTWASWLRQAGVPTWVLQELGGWKSESMVRRCAHMSAEHLQPYAERLGFEPDLKQERVRKSEGAHVTNSPTKPASGGLRLVALGGVTV